MQTALADFIRDTHEGQKAEQILRACVHCGFCTATCPTYQLLGDELDGPRGRIYQIKQILEGSPATRTVQTHLDRCLTCRACETTCPSGVSYHQLLDIGRAQVEQQQPRPLPEQLQRKAMLWLFSQPRRLKPLLQAGRLLRPLMPAGLASKIPPAARTIHPETVSTTRRMLLLDGCVQPAMAPQINQAASKVLARLGIALQVINAGSCCGALPQHLSAPEKAKIQARRNIDAWLPHLENDAEALVITASGCGAHVKDYPHILGEDPEYAGKATKLAAKAKDLIEILAREDLQALRLQPSQQRTAVHTPCTLQHALHLNDNVNHLLQKLGYPLTQIMDNHLCCGSAGTYSLTQREIAQNLRERKLQALNIDHPERIVTANVGCLMHLQENDGTPIMHWIELLEQDLTT